MGKSIPVFQVKRTQVKYLGPHYFKFYEVLEARIPKDVGAEQAQILSVRRVMGNQGGVMAYIEDWSKSLSRGAWKWNMREHAYVSGKDEEGRTIHISYQEIPQPASLDALVLCQ